MPTQGSPNTPFVALTVHEFWPTQAALTIEVLLVALQVPRVYPPHVPAGVP